MPRNIVRAGSNEVQVTVWGETFTELRDQALHEAARYFDVDPAGAVLRVTHSLGKPHIVDADGKVIQYKALITVRALSTDDDDDPRPAGPDVDDDYS